MAITSTVSSTNEWSPLRSVIVGRAEHSQFPAEPERMITTTMPAAYTKYFQPGTPFPADIVAKAQEELDGLAALLEREGVRVCRPEKVDWGTVGGYTGAMPRDGLLVVGNSVIESPYAWRTRRGEIELTLGKLLRELADDAGVSVRRASQMPTSCQDAIYKSTGEKGWAINDSRPAFDAADFLRFGNTLVGQLSNVTNVSGVAYLRSLLPVSYTIELLEATDTHAMHIDTTILPLREGVLVYNPTRVTEAALRKLAVFKDWTIVVYPFKPIERQTPPRYMTTPWLAMNVLSLDEKKIVVEENDVQFAQWLREEWEMEVRMLPFQHVYSLGGSFHCATLDLVRGG